MAVVYDDPEYARTRLAGTMVFLHGEPVYVDSICSEGTAVYKILEENAPYNEIHFTELDLTPPKLGYVNTLKKVEYFTRWPSRQWKQGFRFSQISYGFSSEFSLFSDPFKRTIKGIFPKIQECIENVANKEKKSQAFDRYFCISDEEQDDFLGLWFRNKFIGTIPKERTSNIQPTFEEGKEFMKELFDLTLEGKHVENY